MGKIFDKMTVVLDWILRHRIISGLIAIAVSLYIFGMVCGGKIQGCIDKKLYEIDKQKSEEPE